MYRFAERIIYPTRAEAVMHEEGGGVRARRSSERQFVHPERGDLYWSAKGSCAALADVDHTSIVPLSIGTQRPPM